MESLCPQQVKEEDQTGPWGIVDFMVSCSLSKLADGKCWLLLCKEKACNKTFPRLPE